MKRYKGLLLLKKFYADASDLYCIYNVYISYQSYINLRIIKHIELSHILFKFFDVIPCYSYYDKCTIFLLYCFALASFYEFSHDEGNQITAILYLIAVRLGVTCLELKAAFVHYYDPMIGGQTLLECRWNPAEKPNALYFFTNTGKDLYFICDFYEYPYMCKKRTGASVRHDYVSFGNGTISMTIEKLECSDEGTYKCKLYKVYEMVESESVLRIRVPPTPPKMTNVRVEVQENEEVMATCTANLGYPRPLAIVWKAYFNGYPVRLPQSFKVSANNVTEPGDGRCTVRTQSVARFTARRSENDLVLACFVTNSDFQPVAPTTCGDTGRDLCAKSGPVHVVAHEYGQVIARCSGRSTGSDSEGSSNAVLMIVAVILSVICITLTIIIVVLTKRIKEDAANNNLEGGKKPEEIVSREQGFDEGNPPEQSGGQNGVELVRDNKPDIA
ncbi:hypothetical protein Btru_071662 [Bulinus truncatus]|nr:hypothetical protein Btru_071662 [Bulinus truncatus]